MPMGSRSHTHPRRWRLWYGAVVLAVVFAMLIGSSGASLAAEDAAALTEGSWELVGDTLSVGRKDATTTLLADGTILVTGGLTCELILCGYWSPAPTAKAERSTSRDEHMAAGE